MNKQLKMHILAKLLKTQIEKCKINKNALLNTPAVLKTAFKIQIFCWLH